MFQRIMVSLILGLSVILFQNVNYAQNIDIIFQEAEELISECEQNNAQLLSPSNYKEAKDRFSNATKLKDAKRTNKEIENELKASINASKKAKENCEIAQKLLSEAILAYEKAIEAKAPVSAVKEWKSAKALWDDVIQDLEKGYLDNARKNNDNLISRLQIAEKEAIKNTLLLEARQTIQSAKKIGAQTFAPITFGVANQTLSLVENEINQSAKITDRIKKLAQFAKMEAKHSIFITETAIRLRKDENGWEKGFLAYEEQLNSIAKRFDKELDWSEGPNKAGQMLLFFIDSLLSAYDSQLKLAEQKYTFLENRFLETREQLENELSELKEKYAILESKLGVSEREAQQLKIRQALSEKINRINAAFSPKEVNAQLLENNKILIRITGASFASGSAKLTAQLQKILNRLIEILQDYTSATYEVEGHTDSYGDNEKNLKLSEDRATAVANYIKQNLGLPSHRVRPIGKGENEPIADNETFAGRSLNRRIDIIIKP